MPADHALEEFRVKDYLLRCSDEKCSSLVYLSEAIAGYRILDGMQGRYCVECARWLGWMSPDDVILLEKLLRDEGLIPGKKKEKARRPTREESGQGGSCE